MNKDQFIKILVVVVIVFFIIQMFTWWRGTEQIRSNVYNTTGFATGKIVNFEPILVVPLNEKNKEIVQDILKNNEIDYYTTLERSMKIFFKDRKDILKIREKFDSAIATATVSFTSGKFDINGSLEELSIDPISIYIDPYVGNEELDFEIFATIYEVNDVKEVRVINLNPIPRDEVIMVNGTMNCDSVIVTGYVNWEDRYNANKIKEDIEKEEKLYNVSVYISDEVKYEISPFQMEKIKQKLNESNIEFSNFTIFSFITNSTEKEKIVEIFKAINKTPLFPQSRININITEGNIEEKIAKSMELEKYFENLTVKGNCNVKIISNYYPKEIEKQASLDLKNLKEEFIAYVPVEKLGKMIKNIYLEKMEIVEIAEHAKTE